MIIQYDQLFRILCGLIIILITSNFITNYFSNEPEYFKIHYLPFYKGIPLEEEILLYNNFVSNLDKCFSDEVVINGDVFIDFKNTNLNYIFLQEKLKLVDNKIITYISNREYRQIIKTVRFIEAKKFYLNKIILETYLSS